MGPDSTQREFWETSLLGQNNLGSQANEEGDSEVVQDAGQITQIIDVMAERQQNNIWPME
jgi:hypothetical protein